MGLTTTEMIAANARYKFNGQPVTGAYLKDKLLPGFRATQSRCHGFNESDDLHLSSIGGLYATVGGKVHWVPEAEVNYMAWFQGVFETAYGSLKEGFGG